MPGGGSHHHWHFLIRIIRPSFDHHNHNGCQWSQGRAARGFPPLVIVVVPVIGLSLGAEAKLSSTQLRAEEAAVAAAGHMPLI